MRKPDSFGRRGTGKANTSKKPRGQNKQRIGAKRPAQESRPSILRKDLRRSTIGDILRRLFRN